jgi:hypothetical protein
MGTAMKLSELSKHQRVSELLGLLGDDIIDVEQFIHEMRRYGLTDDDIERFCCGEQME